VSGISVRNREAGLWPLKARLGAGHADVTEATLFLELLGVTALERADVRQNSLLHADHEHRRELEALGGVQGDQRDGVGLLVVFVDVGDQRNVFEE
jgi:hypothetical protein